MGLFSRNPDERTVKPAGKTARSQDKHPKQHGLTQGPGPGCPTRYSGDNVNVSGEGPGRGLPWYRR